jgi:Glycosyltransferase family 9 (heptosyltransferase)
VECQPEIKPLLAANFSGCEWFSVGEQLPMFDLQSPLMSLPRAFNTRVETIPNTVPYLRADAEIAERWKTRMATEGTGKRVGISWAGRETHGNDRNRSMELANFAPLLKTPGVNVFSLQKTGRDRAETKAAGMIDYTEELADFAETAGIVANLDLVICVDTAVAHLAGAMGKPVWLLLPFVADWRWLMGRTDSPWYPGLRIYRQEAIGQWGPVMEKVQRDLREVAGEA